MKKLGIGSGALVGGMLTAPLLALVYLGESWLGLPFMPYDLFDWATRVLPGSVVTFAIDLMISTMNLVNMSVADAAKTAEQIAALIQFIVIGVVVGAVAFPIIRTRAPEQGLPLGITAGALFGLPLIAISVAISASSVHPILAIIWHGALFLCWGAVFGWASDRLNAVSAPGAEGAAGRLSEGYSRRQFLVGVGAATATITVLGAGVGRLLGEAERRRLEEEFANSMAHLSEGTSRSPFPNANASVMPAPGTRPEYTPLKDHYKVFIRVQPTVIDGETWTLPVTGLVDNPLRLTLDDLRNNYEPRSQYVTLRCISGRVGTTLISTTQWTGVSVQDILADAGLQEDAKYMYLRSGDGYYETVDLDLIESDERVMFCYSWDGVPLPSDHGFPLRIWIPDRYGMKQPKWITGVEIGAEYQDGYWVARSWDKDAIVKTTSVVDTVAAFASYESGDETLVPVGGIAYSGARGISAVQVRVDGGPWTDAMLRDPLSETTWVIWRYDWPFQAGEHTFQVRCREADGTPQIEQAQQNRPSGATGIHSRSAKL